MKKLKRILAPVCILAMFCIVQTYAFAAGGASISVNPQTVALGDTFDIAVSFSSKSEAIGSVQAKIEYDADAIRYMSGGGNAVEMSGGSGGISAVGGEDIYNFTYILRFSALKPGKTTFRIAKSEVVGFTSGNDIGGGIATVSIDIIGEQAATPTDGLEDEETETDVEEPTPIEIDLNGATAYLLADFGGHSLPDGFEKTVVQYEGREVVAAANAKNGLTLVCIMDAGGTAGLYVYADAGKTLFPYVVIWDRSGYVLLDAPAPPDAASETTVIHDGHSIKAWDRGDGSYPLVYAVGSGGEPGFYHFDSEKGTLQRARVEQPSASPEPTTAPTAKPTPEPTQKPIATPPAATAPATPAQSPWHDSSVLALLAALAALAVVLLIAVLAVIRKGRQKPPRGE